MVVMKTWRLPSSCIRKRMVATAVEVSTMVTYVIHMATKNTNRLLATSLACAITDYSSQCWPAGQG